MVSVRPAVRHSESDGHRETYSAPELRNGPRPVTTAAPAPGDRIAPQSPRPGSSTVERRLRLPQCGDGPAWRHDRIGPSDRTHPGGHRARGGRRPGPPPPRPSDRTPRYRSAPARGAGRRDPARLAWLTGSRRTSLSRRFRQASRPPRSHESSDQEARGPADRTVLSPGPPPGIAGPSLNR
eukprot:765376-Hanusia_phi.AAC.2